MRINLNLKLSHKGLILVSVPLITGLIFLGILSVLLRQAEIEVQRQVRSKAIISQANTLSKLFYDAGVAMGGYSITKSPLFSDRYDKIVRQIPQDLQELKNLVGDNSRQQQILQNLQGITVTGLKILGEAKAAIDDNRVDVAQFRARHMYKEIRSLADRLQDELRGLTEDERKIESESPETQNKSRAAVKIFIVVGVVFNILLTVALALFFSRGIGKRLSLLTDNSIRLARGEPLNEPLTGQDEIADLDGVFHSMADALMEANRKERAVIENAVDVICSIDVDGKFVAVSPACYSVWGYKPEELMGRRFIELVVPEDHQETIKAVRAVRAERGTRTQFENRTRRKDGSTVTVLWSTYWSETERSMFCVAHDITERKLAEETVKASEKRIRMIIENMLVGLIIITKDGVIESINPASERMFGFRADNLVGRHVMNLFADSRLFSVDNSQDRQKFMENMFAKSLNRIGEFDALKQLGEDFPIELSLSEFETPDGLRYLANILDVSERREVERLKKEFVSTVSHELRTPLTSIRGSLTLLNVGALGSLPDQAKKVVGIAERNTIRLITLINDILDIERLESGKLDMVFDTIGMSSVLERTDQSVRSFADQNGVKLDFKPSTSTVFADGDRLVQVLVNLCSNAIKFSPKGGTVTVVVEEIPNWVEVKVIDRGRGIPAKYKNLLFQRFQQVEASDARKKGGTGLGLAICKGIVESHNGNIGVESEEGKGSVFWFRIPPAKTGTTFTNLPAQLPGQGQAANVSRQSMPAMTKPASPAPALDAGNAHVWPLDTTQQSIDLSGEKRIAASPVPHLEESRRSPSRVPAAMAQAPLISGVPGSMAQPPQTGGVPASMAQPPQIGGAPASMTQPPQTGGAPASMTQPPQQTGGAPASMAQAPLTSSAPASMAQAPQTGGAIAGAQSSAGAPRSPAGAPTLSPSGPTQPSNVPADPPQQAPPYQPEVHGMLGSLPTSALPPGVYPQMIPSILAPMMFQGVDQSAGQHAGVQRRASTEGEPVPPNAVPPASGQAANEGQTQNQRDTGSQGTIVKEEV